MSKIPGVLMVVALILSSVAVTPVAAQVQGQAGGITGRVTDQNFTGIANATVVIIDLSDPLHVYRTGLTNAQGYYQFAGVNNTWDPATGTYVFRYKAYASVDMGGNTYTGYSNNFSVEAASNAWAPIIVNIPQNPTPTPIPGPTETGGITGRVTDQYSNGLANVMVKIVDVTNLSRVYYTGVTNAQGYYQFTNVPNTWDPATGTYVARYIAYASVDNPYQTYANYSNTFTVEAASNAWAPVTIYIPTPTPIPGPTETGGITGRVTDQNLAGVADAAVLIVDASNLTQVYFTGVTNAQGFFQFTNVPNTWDPATGTYAARYLAIATVDRGFTISSGYSNNFTVEAASNAWAPIMVYIPTPTPIPGPNETGGIVGRVTNFNVTKGFAGATVQIVDMANPSQVYFTGVTNAQGYFYFTNVPNTWDPAKGTYVFKYRAYASVDMGGQTYIGGSNNFSVEANSNSWAAIIIDIPDPTPTPVPNGGIAGRVTDQNMCGIANANVRVIDTTNYSYTGFSGTTNDQGVFQITNVPSTWDEASGQYLSKYRVYASANISDQNYANWSNNFAVEASSIAWAPVVIPIPDGAIIGRVVDQCVQGVAGATVRIVDAANTSHVYSTGLTNETGYFLFTNVPNTWNPATGTYETRYLAIASANVVGTAVESYFGNFAVEAGSTAWAGIVINLPAGGIAGRVADQNATGIAGATVIIVEAANRSHVYDIGVTNAQGYYQFTDVPDTWNPATGTYAARYKVYASVSINDRTYGAYSSNFSVEVAGTAAVNVTIRVPAPTPTPVPNGGIAGRVTDQNSNGVANATIRIAEAANTSHIYYSGAADSQGYFQLTGIKPSSLRAGDYVVYATINIAGKTFGAYSNNFTVEPASTVWAPVIIPIPAGAIAGRVIDQYAQGMAGATISIVDAADPSRVYYTGVANAQGYYQLTGVNSTWDTIKRAHTTKYRAYAIVDIGGRTYGSYSSNFTVAPAGIAFANVTIALPAGGISGRITDQNMNGIANTTIRIADAADPSHVYYTGVANSQGYYQFTRVPNTWNASQGTFVAKYKAYATVNIAGMTVEGCSASFAVEPAGTAAVSIAIAIPTGGIAGRVMDPGSNGVANATIKVVDTSNTSRVYFTGTTNAQGYFQLTGVPVTWDTARGTYVARYKVYASADFGGKTLGAYSNSFVVEVNSSASVGIAIPIPAGGISCRVTDQNSTGIANATIRIVDAWNTSRTYRTGGLTNAQGYYQFTGIPSTWNATLGAYEAKYKAYVTVNVGGHIYRAYSDSFAVEPAGTAAVNVQIRIGL